MIGVIVNVLAVALGGVLGTVFSKKLSTRFTTELNKVFGVCAIGMGISSVPLMENMPAVILAGADRGEQVFTRLADVGVGVEQAALEDIRAVTQHTGALAYLGTALGLACHLGE